MNSNITRELVEAIAKARIDHSSEVLRGQRDAGLPLDLEPEFFLSWDDQSARSKHGVCEAVLGQLNELLPHLVAAGWRAPVEAQDERTEDEYPELKSLRERLVSGDEAIRAVQRVREVCESDGEKYYNREGYFVAVPVENVLGVLGGVK